MISHELETRQIDIFRAEKNVKIAGFARELASRDVVLYDFAANDYSKMALDEACRVGGNFYFYSVIYDSCFAKVDEIDTRREREILDNIYKAGSLNFEVVLGDYKDVKKLLEEAGNEMFKPWEDRPEVLADGRKFIEVARKIPEQAMPYKKPLYPWEDEIMSRLFEQAEAAKKDRRYEAAHLAKVIHEAPIRGLNINSETTAREYILPYGYYLLKFMNIAYTKSGNTEELRSINTDQTDLKNAMQETLKGNYTLLKGFLRSRSLPFISSSSNDQPNKNLAISILEAIDFLPDKGEPYIFPEKEPWDDERFTKPLALSSSFLFKAA